MRKLTVILALLAGMVLMPGAAVAQYYKQPISDLNPEIMRIDEKKYLGAKLEAETVLVDASGAEFKLGDMLGKPLVLVLAYYT